MKEAAALDNESLMIIKVVSRVLDQLIAGAKSSVSTLGLFVKFQSSYAPDVSVQSYLERIRKYSGCSDACFVMSLIYIDRLIETRQLMLSQLNVHRLLVTSVMLAAKYHDDLFYNNAYYAKLGGLPLAELNLLEVDFLKLMGFSLFIDQDHYGRYYQELRNYFHCIEPSLPSPVSVAAAAVSPIAMGGGAHGSAGGAGQQPMVRASTSCPDLAVLAAQSAGVGSNGFVYRVPSPHKPHDKSSVNVSNEFYFGGYAAAAAAYEGTTSGVPHAASVSPDFVDGNNSLLVDYASPSGPVEVGSYPYERDVLLHRLQMQQQSQSLFGGCSGEQSGQGGGYSHFSASSTASLHHQPSSDSVAVFPYYLSPKSSGHEGSAPVRQVDHSSSCSWHRSAALMPREEPGPSTGLSIDVPAPYGCGGDFAAYSHLQYLHHQQQQEPSPSIYPPYHRGLGPQGYYGDGRGECYDQQRTDSQWYGEETISPHRHMTYPREDSFVAYADCRRSAPMAGPYVDVPMVVDIHGQLQGAFVHPTAGLGPHHSHLHPTPAYVTAGGGGGRYHPYQRQHSA